MKKHFLASLLLAAASLNGMAADDTGVLTFMGLRDYTVYSISPNGEWAVGYFQNGVGNYYAFRWNLETNELSTGPTVAKVAYHQGLAYKALGDEVKAAEAFNKCISTAGGGRRRVSIADESKYYVAMSQKYLGDEAASRATLAEVQKYLDEQFAESGTTVVDIYSKFGEDGSNNVINARNLYVQGLVKLAQGDAAGARGFFAESLQLNPSNVWAKYYLNTKTN